MDKHTKGPWHVSKLLADTVVADINGTILRVATAQHNQGGIPWDTVDANARLMAAAPDLLDACRALMAAVELIARQAHGDINTSPVYQQARAALAKATGEGDAD